jgi:hypothetical protein
VSYESQGGAAILPRNAIMALAGEGVHTLEVFLAANLQD